MICPACHQQNVSIQTQVITESKSRSFLWNLFMLIITLGLWLIWMIIRKKKTKTTTRTIATCQNCGYRWEVLKNGQFKVIR